MKKSQQLIALADKIESKYEEPAQDFPAPNPDTSDRFGFYDQPEYGKSIFNLINRTSNLAERIASEAMRLGDNLNDFEENPDNFPREELGKMEEKLSSILSYLQNLNR